MKLFVVSRSSELLLNEILKTPAHKRAVIAPKRYVESFQQVGVQVIPVSLSGTDTKTRDERFSEVAMPGEFGNATFDGTELPVWKVLGIDRLRFWYYPHVEQITDVVDLLNPDELVISLDIHSVLPWIVANHVDVRVTAVKVSQLLNRETLDFLKSYDRINTVIVSYNEERQFLLKQKTKAKKIVSAGLVLPGRPRQAELRKKTIGLYYESKYDWKALVMLMDIQLGDKTLVIGFPNNTEWRKFLQTFPNMAGHPQIELHDAIGLTVCEEVLLPSYNESVLRQLPQNIKVAYYDIANTEKASLFSGVVK